MDKVFLITNKEEQNINDAPNINFTKNSSLKKKFNVKKLFSYLIILVAIPAVIALGITLFNDRKYNVISIFIALLALAPFFLAFEKRTANVKELVVIAVMIAISVVGRLIFYPIPGFKPVTAIVIIAAISLGAEAGFLTGAMSALVSNMFFSQGPYTPFQMFTWGILGFIIGLLSKTGIMRYRLSLIIAGVLSGTIFSMIMDVWTVVNIDGVFNFSRYLFAVTSSLPFMAIYAVSNVIFLLVLFKPIDRKLERIKKKYNIFS